MSGWRGYRPPVHWRALWRAACRWGGAQQAHRPPRVGRGKVYPYKAKGGPYDGAVLWLALGDTARLRVGNWRGRYLCAIVAGRGKGVTKWIPYAEGS